MDIYSETLIIYYDEEIGDKPLLEAIELYNASIIYPYNITNGIAIVIPEGADIEDAIEFFSNVDGVHQVNINYC